MSYVQSSTANPYGWRPWNSRLNGLGAKGGRRSLGFLGDANADWWNAYHLRSTLYAQAADLDAQGQPVRAQLTSVYNQMMAIPGYNGNAGTRTPAIDAQYSALSAQYGPLQAQLVSLSNQRNAVLAQYSATDWILNTPAPGPDPTITTAVAPSGQPVATPPSTAANPPATAPAVAPAATTSMVPAAPSWVPAPLSATVSLPLLGDVPVLYIVGAAAAALFVFGSQEGKHSL